MARKFLVSVFLISFVAAVNCGCMKIGTYTHERVDLEMRGNRGYLVGNPPTTASRLERPDRKVLELEITLPGSQEKAEKKERKEKEQISQPVYQPEVKPGKSHPKIK